MAGSEYDSTTHGANIHFDVTPGTRARVDVGGGHIRGREERKLLPIYQIAGLDPELMPRSPGRI